MSHFVAALALDGAPLEGALLARLAEGLPELGVRSRLRQGPFALAESWRGSPSTAPAEPEAQAVQVGGAVRLDRLGPAPRPLQHATVRQLWRAGGLGALAGLRGDLGFVLWDARAGTLVALRDLFGVRPLYHARVGRLLLVASDPAPLLRHPGVDLRPDETALGDFLLVGENAHPGRSYLRGVARVRPGHHLVVRGGRIEESRHDRLEAAAWDAPAPPPETVVPELLERLRRAVARRLPPEGAAILLSGGLDSGAVAATAASLLGERAGERLLACTQSAEPLLRDELRHARGVARALGIPHHVEPLDGRPLFPRERIEARDPTGPGLELRETGALWTRAAGHAPVILSGFGGDAALLSSPGAVGRLVAHGRIGEALGHVTRHLRFFGRPPRLGLRALWRRSRAAWRPAPAPAWLAPAFARRLELGARWRWLQGPLPRDLSRRRPEAAASLASSFWPNLCENLAPTAACPAEVCHPWLDADLVEWLVGLPSIPWCIEKHVLREAMRGWLPEATRRRPKSTLPTFPPQPIPREHVAHLARTLRRVPRLAAYVDVEAVLRALEGAAHRGRPQDWVELLPPLAAGLWLRDLQEAERFADTMDEEKSRRVA